MRIFPKIKCHNKILHNRKHTTQSINLVPNNNDIYNKSKQYAINQYDSSLWNTQYKIPNSYRIKHFSNLMNTYKMMNLWWQHDRDFNLQSFKRGTKQVNNSYNIIYIILIGIYFISFVKL